MKTLYLSSEINVTAKSIAEDIGDISKLKTVFISTAAEGKKNSEVWLAKNRQGLIDAAFNLTDYTITGKTPDQIERDLEKFDIIHVNGGSANYLIKQAKKSGFDKWIKKAVNSGKIYIGSSAGSISACIDIPGYYKEGIQGKAGFGLTDVLVLPHWGREDKYEAYFKERFSKIYEDNHKAILLRDSQYVRCKGDDFRIVDVS